MSVPGCRHPPTHLLAASELGANFSKPRSFTRFSFLISPPAASQTIGPTRGRRRSNNTCGLYVILNAQAIMLEIRTISLHSYDDSRPGGCEIDVFGYLRLLIVGLMRNGLRAQSVWWPPPNFMQISSAITPNILRPPRRRSLRHASRRAHKVFKNIG